MKEKQDYVQDIAEIRSMMERSSKFISLSGWAGIFAGVYALAGVLIAYNAFDFNPNQLVYTTTELPKVILLAFAVLILALGTAIYFSYKKASKKGEIIWNSSSRRLLINMAVPLVTGGILIIILISQNLLGLAAPMTLLFYGLALYNAAKFTYDVVKVLGIVQIILGLISAYFIESGLFFWAIGFGVVHIIYGIYIYFRYER